MERKKEEEEQGKGNKEWKWKGDREKNRIIVKKVDQNKIQIRGKRNRKKTRQDTKINNKKKV